MSNNMTPNEPTITDHDIRRNRERSLGMTGADIVSRRCVCWGCPTRDGEHCERGAQA